MDISIVWILWYFFFLSQQYRNNERLLLFNMMAFWNWPRECCVCSMEGMSPDYDSTIKDKSTMVTLQTAVTRFSKSAMKVIQTMMGKQLRLLYQLLAFSFETTLNELHPPATASFPSSSKYRNINWSDIWWIFVWNCMRKDSWPKINEDSFCFCRWSLFWLSITGAAHINPRSNVWCYPRFNSRPRTPHAQQVAHHLGLLFHNIHGWTALQQCHMDRNCGEKCWHYGVSRLRRSERLRIRRGCGRRSSQCQGYRRGEFQVPWGRFEHGDIMFCSWWQDGGTGETGHDPGERVRQRGARCGWLHSAGI